MKRTTKQQRGFVCVFVQQDKIYAENKLKALYNSQDESHHDVNKFLADVKSATWSPRADAPGQTAGKTLFTLHTLTGPKATTFTRWIPIDLIKQNPH